MFSFLNKSISTIHSAALILGAAGFLSRLLGLVRDRLLAGHFGASRELDAYYAAFQVPDFMYSILLLGAASMAILPLFAEHLAGGREKAERFIRELASFFLVSAAVIVALGIAFAPLVIRKIFPGFDAVAYGNAVFLTRVIFLSPLLLGLSGVLTSVVQVHHKFLAYALAGICYNIGIIIGILAFVPLFGVRGLGFGVVLGAFLHFLTQYFAYRSLGYSLRLTKNIWTDSVKEVLLLSLPRVISLSLTQITLVVMMGIASTLAAGSLTVFQFANNLGFLPMGIFAVSYATALFPRLSENAIAKDGRAFLQNILFGVRTMLFWIVPLVCLFVVLRAHIVRVVLGAGAFDWSDTRLTAAAFAVLSVALIGESMNVFFMRGYYSLKSTWLPLVLDALAMGAGILGAFFFTDLLRASPSLAHAVYSLLRISDVSGGEVLGVVFGFSIGVILNTALLMSGLLSEVRRYFGSFPKRDLWKEFRSAVAQIASGGILGGVAAYYALQFLSGYFILDTFLIVFLEGLVAGLIGIAVHCIALYLMGNEDLEVFLGSLQRKFFKVDVLPQGWNGDKTSLEQ